MSGLKVLLTGATGYIGGSVLTAILASESPVLSDIDISVLVRGKDRAQLFAEKGLHVELFEDLDQADLLEDVASKYDVAIQCVPGSHFGSAAAIIRGLGRRMSHTGKQTHYIHLSGISSLSDLPVSGQLRISHVFSDRENIYAYEQWRQSINIYEQRTCTAVVQQAGLAAGVRTTVLMPPTVWGAGTGLVNRISVQTPLVIAAAVRRRRAFMVGDQHRCRAVFNHVHVEDLARLYEILLERVVRGLDVPHGERGFLFAEAGEFAWAEYYENIASALYKRGRIGSRELATLSIKEAAEELCGRSEHHAEILFAANARTKAFVAREWGWRPEKTTEDFLNAFEDEADAVLERLEGNPESVNLAKHFSKPEG